MGHSRSHTFAYYVQVQDDTQSAFMGTPTRDALIKLATNSSLTRDASVPQHLSDEKKQEIEQLTELTDLKRKRDQLRRDLIISCTGLEGPSYTPTLKGPRGR
jgi:hypothetical protein